MTHQHLFLFEHPHRRSFLYVCVCGGYVTVGVCLWTLLVCKAWRVWICALTFLGTKRGKKGTSSLFSLFSELQTASSSWDHCVHSGARGGQVADAYSDGRMNKAVHFPSSSLLFPSGSLMYRNRHKSWNKDMWHYSAGDCKWLRSCEGKEGFNLLSSENVLRLSDWDFSTSDSHVADGDN